MIDPVKDNATKGWSLFGTRAVLSAVLIALCVFLLPDLKSLSHTPELIFDQPFSGTKIEAWFIKILLVSTLSWVSLFLLLVLLQTRFQFSMKGILPSLSRINPFRQRAGLLSRLIGIVTCVIIGVFSGYLMGTRLLHNALTLLRSERAELMENLYKAVSPLILWATISLFLMGLIIAIISQAIWYIRSNRAFSEESR